MSHTPVAKYLGHVDLSEQLSVAVMGLVHHEIRLC